LLSLLVFARKEMQDDFPGPILTKYTRYLALMYAQSLQARLHDGLDVAKVTETSIVAALWAIFCFAREVFEAVSHEQNSSVCLIMVVA